MSNVKQMLTVLARNNAALRFEDGIRDLAVNLDIETSAVSKRSKPTLGLTTRLTVLLIADIHGPTGLFGLEVVVDDLLRMEPADVLRVEEFEKYNLLAVIDGIAPGNHQVSIRWRPLRPPGAVFGTRTLTVWETVVEGPPPVIGQLSAQALISDLDIYRSAAILVRERGEDAALEAASRADTMLDKGDLGGQRVWLRILAALETLQRTERPTGTLHH